MNQNTNIQENIAVMHTGKDLMTAVFIVSILINLVVFIFGLMILVEPSLKATLL